jgi:hypothetical protein
MIFDKPKFGWSKFAPKMLQVISKNFQFWHCKFSFSADPVILNLKLQLAEEGAIAVFSFYFPGADIICCFFSFWTMSMA